jgi:hypothetical protein
MGDGTGRCFVGSLFLGSSLLAEQEAVQAVYATGRAPVEAIQGRSVENGVEQATLFEHGSSV